MAGIEHGGDLATVARRFGRPIAAWLDLSTGVNPQSFPVPEIPAAAWTRLPQADRLASLIEAARDRYGVPALAGIVAAPGTQALLQWLPKACPAAAVAVAAPTYGEYVRTWAASGARILPLEDSEPPDEAEVAVIANPNNPDGRRREPEELLALAGHLADKGGLLVVDEAFADVTPGLSLAGRCGLPGLLVLRSFGKFYGLAGVRLGFALGEPETVARLADLLGPWAVPGPAIEIGIAALRDRNWAERARVDLAPARTRLEGLLEESGLRVVGGTDLFVLAETPDASALWERLCHEGILVRRFAYAPAWLRFGLPGGDGDFARLERALGH